MNDNLETDGEGRIVFHEDDLADDANPHVYEGETRLSNAYTIGRDGKRKPKWCGDITSAASKAWLRGHNEYKGASKS